MKYIYILLIFTLIISCKQKQVIVEVKPPIEKINKIEGYVNEIESFIHHINISTKDYDSISVSELNTLKNSHHFTTNVTQKNIIYRNGKIVKAKYRDFLENNFIKIKSFYYDNDILICVKIYELLPSVSGDNKVYSRKIYYQENTLLYDSFKEDAKYNYNGLLSFGIQKIEEEYQARQ